MKIVVFGTDNSGKTTLCNSLAELLNLKIVPPLGPKCLIDQIKYINNYLSKNEDIIFDRFPTIEEYCCGNVLRGRNNFENIECKLWHNNIDLFVFCDPGISCITNWGAREQMNGIKENINELYKYYKFIHMVLKKDGYNVFTYNWQNETAEEFLKRIEKENV